jgi:hypothetical protein
MEEHNKVACSGDGRPGKRVTSTREYISSSECGFAFFSNDGYPAEQITRDEQEGERTGKHRSNCSQSKSGKEGEAKIAKGG